METRDQAAETPHRHDEPCPLLQLPGELRNQIFEDALREPGGIIIHISEDKTSTNNKHIMALEATCKQFRREVGNLIFELNVVKVHAPLFGHMSKDACVPEFKDRTIVDRLRTTVVQLYDTRRLVHAEAYFGQLQRHRMFFHDLGGMLRDVASTLHILRNEGCQLRIHFAVLSYTGIMAACDIALDSEAVANMDMKCLSRAFDLMAVRNKITDAFFRSATGI
ncbi:hypothetical protein LTR36_003234 [Oleoguttula mirabilis]|uniref:F-box domain-containing protein n=1 Tax=Oleoguttula mirabilis TaxID=1507867 RepID=A0AAV9JWZ1_9PEZI|nr:hypothetical protein LTR36_003234 [Oleoguttula mirabilis]